MVWLIIGVIVLLAIVLVVVGIRAPQSDDPIQERLSELTVSDEVMSLEELELSQDFCWVPAQRDRRGDSGRASWFFHSAHLRWAGKKGSIKGI